MWSLNMVEKPVAAPRLWNIAVCTAAVRRTSCALYTSNTCLLISPAAMTSADVLSAIVVLLSEMEPSLRVTGHLVSDIGQVGSGHGSVCQTRCLAWFWVLTCAFIVALFLPSNTISANYPVFGSVPVSARNIYLLTCWLSLWCYDVSGFDVISATVFCLTVTRVGSGQVTG